MKRLFTLRFQNGQLALFSGLPVYFSNKAKAKAARDAGNAGYKVSIGPDHRSFKKH